MNAPAWSDFVSIMAGADARDACPLSVRYTAGSEGLIVQLGPCEMYLHFDSASDLVRMLSEKIAAYAEVSDEA